MSESETKPPTGDQPTIDMQPRRVTCPRHGEVFKAGWPNGYPTFAVTMVTELLKSEAFLASLGEGDSIQLIEKALDEKPACCRTEADRLLQLYVESGVGVVKTCMHCFKTRLGTPYRILDVTGRTKLIRHLCFECVVYRLGVHKPN